VNERDSADQDPSAQHAKPAADDHAAGPREISAGVLVAAYTAEGAADKTLTDLTQVRSLEGLRYEDAAVVRRDSEGRVHVTETGDMSARSGAGIGALIGGIIGILAGPSGMVIGAGAGAALGGLAAHPDIGFDQHSLKELGGVLQPGTSALVVTTSKDLVEHRGRSTEGENKSVARQLAAVIADHLANHQDVLLSMVLTDDGVAAIEVAAAPDQRAVFNISASDAESDG
jgi:uncharacterized membrane protein